MPDSAREVFDTLLGSPQHICLSLKNAPIHSIYPIPKLEFDTFDDSTHA